MSRILLAGSGRVGSVKRSGDGKLLLAGGVGGQALLLAVTPILTRTYTPADLGYFQIGLTAALILLPLATRRIEIIIPAQGTSSGVATLYRTALIQSIIVGILAILFGIVLEWCGVVWGGSIGTLTAICLVGLSVQVIENARLLYLGRLRILAYRNFTTGAVAAGAQVMGGFVFPDAMSLAVALLIGRAAALCFRAPDDDSPRQPWRASWRMLMEAGFPLSASAGAGLLANITLQLPFLFIATVLGPAAAGQVAIAQRIAATPASLLSQSLIQLTTHKISTAARTSVPSTVRVVRRLMLGTSALGGTMLIVVVIVALTVVEPVLGSGWQRSADVAAIISIAFACQIAVSPVTVVLPIVEMQRWHLFYEGLRVMLVAALFAVISTFSDSLLAFAWTWSASAVLGYAGMAVWLISGSWARRGSR